MINIQQRSAGAIAALVTCLMFLLLQGCAGWGDVFEERRSVAGRYFLMTSGDGRSPSQYFLFQRGRSGSIAGPVKELGWNEQFVLLWDEGSGGDWRMFPIDPYRSPIPRDEAERRNLFSRLRQTVPLRAAQEIWDQAP